MEKEKSKARGHFRRTLAALLSVALATGGPWQVALAEGVAIEGGEPDVVLVDDGIVVMPSDELEVVPEEGLEVAPEESSGESVAALVDGTLEAEEQEPVLRAQSGISSYYATVFTYGDKQYQVDGMGVVPLADVLTQLGIDGEVQQANVSGNVDAGQLSVWQGDYGVWYLRTDQRLSGTAHIVVVAGGLEYQIAAQAVGAPYYDPTETKGDENKSVDSYDYLPAPGGGTMTIRAGWWTFFDDLTYSGRVTISGNVNLILSDGHTMTCKDGIYVPEGSSLTIWGQSTDKDAMGKLVVTASQLKAGIGAVEDNNSGSVTINGGYVEATGGDNCAGIGGAYNADAGPITINGGYVDAKGDYGAAGIGGGNKGQCGSVNITGGEVHATGGKYGAGIGGAYKKTNGTITITGGEVYAKGTAGGAGIGAGTEADCGNSITIRQGAVVTADGSSCVSEGAAECGAGIGGGAGDEGTGGDLESTVTIEGSTVTARAGVADSGHTGNVIGGAGIGAGSSGNAKDGKVYITDATVYAYGSGGSTGDDRGGAGIGGGAEDSGHGGEGAGLVEIKGLKTVVVAQAGYGSCSAIGHGDNDSYMGNLTIEAGLKVQAGNDGTNYERLFLYDAGDKDERAAACKWRRSARIEACDHPSATFDSIDQSFHRQHDCAYCGTTFNNEAHNTDGDEGACSVCGYLGKVFSLSFDGNGATGAMKPLYIAEGKSTNLPDCDFDVPEGKAFDGWEISGTTYAAGDPYTPVADATAKALWTGQAATVSFNAGADAFEYTGSMAPDVTKVGEKYELPDCDFVPADDVQANFVAWKVEGGTPDTGLKLPLDEIDITGDVTVTAQWQHYWVVTYDPGDGSEPEEYEVDDGDMAPELDEFEREGYVFKGWTLGGTPYDFTQPVTGDLTLVASWEKEKAQVALMSHSLTLSGAIGVDYFMNLSPLDDATRQKSYMEFAVGRGSKRATHVARFDAGFRDANGNGYYGFSCPTNSIQMAENITATFHYGDEVLELPDYSIKAYVEGFDAYQAAHADDGKAFDDKTVTLVHAIADYGHYAQPYLSSENGWKIGTDYAEMDSSYVASYADGLEGIKAALSERGVESDTSGTPVASATMRLRLDSGTTIEALLSPAEGASFSAADVAAVTAAFPGREPVVTRRTDGRISVRVDGVSAHLLATPLVVSYGGHQVMSLSALSFANVVVSGSDASKPDAARDAMCALYKYYEAAAAYRP